MTTSKVKTSLFILLGIGIITTACKKDEEKKEEPPTKTEMLTGNNWVRTRIEIEPAIDFDGNGTQENNLTPYFAPCDLDDFMNLKTDKTYIYEEGPSKCDPNDPQVIETGTWTLNSDNTRLVLTAGNGGTTDYIIKALSNSSLVTDEQATIQGVNYTITTTYD